MVVLSGFHLKTLLAHPHHGTLGMSLDLGLSRSAVGIAEEFLFPNGERLARAVAAEVIRKRNVHDCHELAGGRLRWLYGFDEKEHVACKLYEPAIDWPPTLMINGAFMHAVATTTPVREAEAKVRSLRPKGGRVFETCMGLGYCTQALLRAPVARVIACEISQEVIALARRNPWSQGALRDPRVVVLPGSALDAAGELAPGSIDSVLHDPPTLHRAGELYSAEMYRALLRALPKGGRLYHYVGTESERTRHRYRQGVIRRLRAVGFSRIWRAHRGVVAVK